MRMLNTLCWVGLAVGSLTLSACGGGGGGDNSSSTPTPTSTTTVAEKVLGADLLPPGTVSATTTLSSNELPPASSSLTAEELPPG